jgi:hypothetical protein
VTRILKKCVRETEAVARFLAPYRIEKQGSWLQLETIDELCLIKTLRYNKVAMEFRKKLTSDPSLEERIFGAFPHVKTYCDDINLKAKKDLASFRKISHEFGENNIEFLLIKSDGDFPYESDNLDILIKPTMLGKVAGLLKHAGYRELSWARERHKYLFRDTREPDVLPLHIHTRVEWEGTSFIDSSLLWSRSRSSEGAVDFLVPSPEDCILITCAHLFFENHEVKLADLIKIASKFKSSTLDVDYMLEHAGRLDWSDAFCLTLLSADLIHRELCGENLLSTNVASVIEKRASFQFSFVKRAMKHLDPGFVPLSIPYSVSASFFLLRVLRESDLSLAARFRNVDWIAANILRERARRS